MKSSVVTQQQQRGFTFWSIVFYILVLGSAMILALRMAPSYLEYMQVRDIVERSVQEFDPGNMSTRQVRTRIRKLLKTSQVYAIKAEDVEIYREDGKIVFDATYETRFPLFWIVDGVMHFDDLIYKVDDGA